MIPKVEGFGLNVDINHYNDASIRVIVNHLKVLKVKWVRTEIDYFKYQDESKIQHLHTFFKLCREENITVVALLSQFVAGNLTSIFFSYKYHKHILSYIDDYLLFVRKVGNLFKNEVYYWEVWNEENFRRFWIGKPNAKEYTVFLSMVSKVLRDIDSNNKIIFGGVTGNDVTPIIPLPRSIVQYKGFIREAISHGADKLVDYFAFHPYIFDCYFSISKPEKVLSIIKHRIRETKDRYNNIQLLITEFGISSSTSIFMSEEDLAYIYSELFKYAEELNIPICIYALIDLDAMHFSNLNPERGFGLLSSSLEPKKLYNALSKYLV